MVKWSFGMWLRGASHLTCPDVCVSWKQTHYKLTTLWHTDPEIRQQTVGWNLLYAHMSGTEASEAVRNLRFGLLYNLTFVVFFWLGGECSLFSSIAQNRRKFTLILCWKILGFIAFKGEHLKRKPNSSAQQILFLFLPHCCWKVVYFWPVCVCVCSCACH